MKILVFTPFSLSGHLDSWREKICESIVDSGNTAVDLNPASFYPLEYFQNANLDFIVINNDQKSKSTINVNQIQIMKVNQGFRDGLKFTALVLRKLFPSFVWQGIRPLRRIILEGLVRIDRYLPGKKVKVYSESDIPLTMNDVYQQIKLSLLIERDVDLVLITYLDGLSDTTFESWYKLEQLLSVKIAVIVFKITPIIKTALKSSQSIFSIGTVDQSSFNQLNELVTHPKVILLPDFPSVDNLNSSVQSEGNRLFSNSNPTIGIIGSVDWRKNLDLFMDCAFSAEGVNYNWLIVGKIYFEKMSMRTIVRIHESLKGKHQNIMIIPDFQSNADYVRLYNLIDIHFLMYLNWNSASNGVTNLIMNNRVGLLNIDSPYFKSLAASGLGISTRNNPESVFESILEAGVFEINHVSRNEYLAQNSEEKFQEKLCLLLGVKNDN